MEKSLSSIATALNSIATALWIIILIMALKGAVIEKPTLVKIVQDESVPVNITHSVNIEHPQYGPPFPIRLKNEKEDYDKVIPFAVSIENKERIIGSYPMKTKEHVPFLIEQKKKEK